MGTKYWLIAYRRLVQKQCGKVTDHPYMNLVVHHGRRATQQISIQSYESLRQFGFLLKILYLINISATKSVRQKGEISLAELSRVNLLTQGSNPECTCIGLI